MGNPFDKEKTDKIHIKMISNTGILTGVLGFLSKVLNHMTTGSGGGESCGDDPRGG